MRLARLDVARWPEAPAFVEDSRLAIDGVSLAFPAIALGDAGAFAVAFVRMGADGYPSAAFTGRLAGDLPGSFRPLVTYMAGRALHDYPDSTSPLRIGGYSGAARDPADGSAWLVAQYADRPCVWGLRVARVAFDDAGDPRPFESPSPSGGASPCVRPQGGPYEP